MECGLPPNIIKKALAVFCPFDEFTNIFQVVISVPKRDYETHSPFLPEQQCAKCDLTSSDLCQSSYIHPKCLPTASFLEFAFFMSLFSQEIALSSFVKLFFDSKNIRTSGAVSESVLWDFMFFCRRLFSLPGCCLLGPSLISK